MRARSGLPDTLLAAMPVFGPPSTIVMGTPSSTGRTEAEWTRTILHEHFHQWQDALPTYFKRVEKLNLSGGDQSGMWMLNYAFPYRDPDILANIARASQRLGAALDVRGKPDFVHKLREYLVARRQFAHAAGVRNWRYIELELWKEGVARWTEIELGKRYPDPAVATSAKDLERRTRAWLLHPNIAEDGREFVYPYGAAEAMLLDACGASWKRAYPRRLSLGPLLQAAAHSCHAGLPPPVPRGGTKTGINWTREDAARGRSCARQQFRSVNRRLGGEGSGTLAKNGSPVVSATSFQKRISGDSVRRGPLNRLPLEP